VLHARHLVVAVVVSPAVVFLLFLGVFRAFYVTWAEQHAKPIAEAQLHAQSRYDITIDSVAISLSSLTFFKVRVWQNREQIGEIESMVFEEPSLLSLIVKRNLVARRIEVRAIQTTRDDVRKFFEVQAPFSAESP
jgi:hypothetical protein